MTSLDFGYPWWLNYGHLAILFPTLAILAVAYRRHWSKWIMMLLGGLVLWSLAAFLVVRFVVDINGNTPLPTESFFRAGQGRVLDIGAGTGRSSIMVLTARPQATLVALDLFGESFDQHFGKGVTPQERLMANLRAAGVEKRATITTSDMRKLPFQPADFDAIVSAYAIDHIGREGIVATLAECARVLKPGGDFLLMLVGNEPWSKFSYGPLISHGAPRGPAWWTARLTEAGFDVQEQGTRPLTLYLLARRR
jgi:SAM-dependent methyltransferase